MSQFYDQASLVMIPSGYKTGKVYSQKPLSADGELTFTRASNATRIGPDGKLEKVRTNLALYSEAFDNAAWTKYQSSITANSTTAPDGTLTADTLADTAANDSHQLEQSIVFPASEATISIFAKANTLSHIKITAYDGAAFRDSGIFNLSNGTVSGAGSIINVGNGWYRCSYTFSATGGAGVSYVFTSNGSSIVYAGSGQSVYIWGYQLEAGVLTNYIPTTSAAVSVGPVSGLPRLDYSGGASCPSLLLEPQRTNQNTKSNEFVISSGFWYDFNGKVPVANQGTSPEGYTNAWTLPLGSALSTEYGRAIGLVIGDKTTGSIWAKGNETAFNLELRNSVDNAIIGSVTVNLTSGTITSGSGNVEIYSDGWYRISTTGTSTIANGYPRTVFRNPNSACLIYGSQYEAGSYATSYIPTLGAAVTRLADAAYKTGISSLIGQTEGTLFVDFNWEQKDGVFFVNSISDGTTTNEIFLSFGSTNHNRLRFSIASSGVGASVSFDSAALASGRYKVAFAYANNDAVGYINGVQQFTDTSATIPATSEFKFLRANNTLGFDGTINQQLIFKTRLTNAQLAELTTL